jgi:hypothetical protein
MSKRLNVKLRENAIKRRRPMGLNIQRQPATPESNAPAAELLNSFYAIRAISATETTPAVDGVTYGFWTLKVFKEIDDLLAKNLQVEEYDLEQLRNLAGKDVQQYYAKRGIMDQKE